MNLQQVDEYPATALHYVAIGRRDLRIDMLRGIAPGDDGGCARRDYVCFECFHRNDSV